MKETSATYQELFEQTPAAIAILRGEHMIFELTNPQYLEILGRTESQLIGIKGREALPEMVDQGVWDILDQVYETEKPFQAKEFSAEIDRKSTGELDLAYFNFIAKPFYEDNKKAGIFIHAYEVSELVFARQKMEEQEEQLRAFAENLPVLAWTAHADGSIYWYNKAWYNYTGKTEEDMLGWGWQSVHSPEFLPQVLSRWQASIDTGLEFEMTFPLLSASGRFRSFLTKVSPYYDASGNLSKWFGTNTLLNE